MNTKLSVQVRRINQMIINGNCFDIQPHSPNKLLQEMYENIII